MNIRTRLFFCSIIAGIMTLETMERGDTTIKVPSWTEPFTRETANEFIEVNFSAIERIVGAILTRKKIFPQSDLYPEAFGDALERIVTDLPAFDPEKNMRVSTYIFQRALWGIQDSLRENDSVTRRTRQILKENNMTSSGDCGGPFSDPTFHATHPPISWEGLEEEHCENTMALNDGATISIEEQVDANLKWDAIRCFLDSNENPMREREMLRLRLDGLHFKEIGKRFGISESCACQAFRKVSGKLIRLASNFKV